MAVADAFRRMLAGPAASTGAASDPAGADAPPVASARAAEDLDLEVRGGNVEPVAPAPQPVALEPYVPRGLTVAAGFSWRLLVIAAFVLGVMWLAGYFSAVTVPVVLAVLLAAMLDPVKQLLVRLRVPPMGASALTLLGMIVFIAGVLTFVGAQVAQEGPQLVDMFGAGIDSLMQWIRTLPFAVDQSSLDGWIKQGLDWLRTQATALASGVASAGIAFGNFAVGLLTCLITTFFLLGQGRTIFTSALGLLVPRRYRAQTDAASQRGWTSLVAYMRAAVIVALVDAAGVALAAMILGVPLVSALFALTFFLAFIPIVGAVTAGAVAVLLALVSHGWVSALIMLGAVILVMQLESNLLQPLVMGKAVNLHALAVILGITVGGVLGGILGALLAIPTLAFLVAFVSSLRNDEVEALPHL
ncbi:MAG: AI-2E family transporter [Propioniciclava sp.]|uniref:AI-2E family transporter n=1 Tax=Propioniciclava sp. TaxID=2038686 RepID=UPI0039E2DA69